MKISERCMCGGKFSSSFSEEYSTRDTAIAELERWRIEHPCEHRGLRADKSETVNQG